VTTLPLAAHDTGVGGSRAKDTGVLGEGGGTPTGIGSNRVSCDSAGSGILGEQGDGGRAALREAAAEMVSEQIPLRAKGLVGISRLIQERRSAVLAQLELVLDLCEAQLHHDDSFVYQAAINAFEVAASVAPSTVLPRLASLLLPQPGDPTLDQVTVGDLSIRDVIASRAHIGEDDTCGEAGPGEAESDGGFLLRPRSTIRRVGSSANSGRLKGERRESVAHDQREGTCERTDSSGTAGRALESGSSGEETIDSSAERRLKAAQAICQAVRRLGETVPAHAETVMGSLLIGACDLQPAVRSSCLACLADVAAQLKFALHPWAVELLQCVGAALEGENDAVARQAACYVLTMLLRSLGSEALVVLSGSQLAWLHRRLRLLRDDASSLDDEKLHGHACAALEEMRLLGLALVRGSRGDSQGAQHSDGGVRVLPGELPTIRMPFTGGERTLERLERDNQNGDARE
jgi:hypothetical protein